MKDCGIRVSGDDEEVYVRLPKALRQGKCHSYSNKKYQHAQSLKNTSHQSYFMILLVDILSPFPSNLLQRLLCPPHSFSHPNSLTQPFAFLPPLLSILHVPFHHGKIPQIDRRHRATFVTFSSPLRWLDAPSQL